MTAIKSSSAVHSEIEVHKAMAYSDPFWLHLAAGEPLMQPKSNKESGNCESS